MEAARTDMKLVLVISTMTSGGAERVLSTLANSWANKGRDVTLVTTHDDGSPPFYDLDPEVTHRPILLSSIPGGGYWSNIKRTKALRGMIKEANPDLVVSFLDYTNILTLLACKGLNVPVVVSERLDPRIHRLTRVWEWMRQLLYPGATVLVNQTEAAASWFRSLMKDKISIIPNPVAEPDNQTGVPERELRKPSLVAMGRLHPQKGFDSLLRAMRIVHDTAPDLHLTVLGEGPLRSDLEALRDGLELQDVVYFPGRVKNPAAVLRQAELFVMSSITEGFPNVLCEAMALGLPVISTDCPSGPAEIIQDGRSGLLVPVGDHEALAAAILGLLADSVAREEMGVHARQVVDRFSLERVLGEWEAVLAKAAKGRDQDGARAL
jgi:glycosyltransferase involved in cell wall biosynthesis